MNITTARKTAPARQPVSRRRRLTGTVCLSMPALAVLAFGGQLLITGWFTERAGGTHHVQDLAWGALEGVLLLGALTAVLLRRPCRPAVLLQSVAVVSAMAVTMVLVASPDPVTLVLAGLIVAGVLLRAEGGLLQGRHPSWASSLLCALAAVPLAVWALSSAAAQRAGDGEHAELLGYTGVTAFALGLLATLAVASLRQPGWRWSAGCAAVAAGVVGTASLLWPHDASSPGMMGGLALLALGATSAITAATDAKNEAVARRHSESTEGSL